MTWEVGAGGSGGGRRGVIAGGGRRGDCDCGGRRSGGGEAQRVEGGKLRMRSLQGREGRGSSLVKGVH